MILLNLQFLPEIDVTNQLSDQLSLRKTSSESLHGSHIQHRKQGNREKSVRFISELT